MDSIAFSFLLQYIDHYEQYIITIYLLKKYIDYYGVDNNINNNNNNNNNIEGVLYRKFNKIT